ncbi:MAG: RHS repeat-associated core domain-containing protein, partial [Chitinophagaceae bacterium]
WLKGVNSTNLNPAQEMGKDGLSTGNSMVAKDVVGFGLHYYQETSGNNFIDYKAIGGSSAFANPGTQSNFVSLYNGNIGAISINNAGLLKGAPASTNPLPLFYNYRYDQLNRIVSMQAYKNLDIAGNHWNNAQAIDDYKEKVSYDPNGNILTYDRYGSPSIAGKQKEMDSLKYQYYYYDGNNNLNTYDPTKPLPEDVGRLTNQLAHVDDRVVSAYDEDIDDQAPGNYTYDAIGNLKTDVSEGITGAGITWNVYGKISRIVKGGNIIIYSYDAAGNRISKTAGGKTTIYVRDAGGNVMSVYEKNGSNLTQAEVHLYGSSRLGFVSALTIPSENFTLYGGLGIGKRSTFTRGEKIFELSNHLGNVLVTISDKKVAFDSDANGLIDFYESDVVGANDYYTGGMQMPGRKYQLGSTTYRYGFNGKENDNEVKGEGNQQDYGMRIYDPRSVRFLSVDPLQRQFPFYTPYQFAGNTPIQASDLDGLEEYHYTLTFDKGGKPKLNYLKTVTEKPFLFFWSYKPPEQKVIEYGGETFKFSAGGYSTSPMIAMGANSYDNLDGWLNGGYEKELFGQAFYSTYATNLLDIGVFAEGTSTDIAVGKSWAKANAHSMEDASPATTTNKQVTAANNGNTQAAKSNTSQAKAPTVVVGQAELNVYRGGGKFTVGDRDIKVDPQTGLVKTTHGLSVHTNPGNVSKFGGAFKVISIPSQLKIIQRGNDANHFEIVPVKEMSKEVFQNYLDKIKIEKINTTSTTTTNGG